MSTQEVEGTDLVHIENPLEGISGKMSKGELLSRAQRAAETMRTIQTVARGRRKWQSRNPGSDELHTVVVTATEDEWIEAMEFLFDFNDLLPMSLKRLLEGGRVMFELQTEAAQQEN